MERIEDASMYIEESYAMLRTCVDMFQRHGRDEIIVDQCGGQGPWSYGAYIIQHMHNILPFGRLFDFDESWGSNVIRSEIILTWNIATVAAESERRKR